MYISRDWQIKIDQAAFMQEYGHTYARALRRPGMSEVFDATFCEVAELVEPAVAWNYFPVQEIRHEKVILDGGKRIGNGPVTTVMGGAEQLAIGVCTIGPQVNERIHYYKEQGEALRSMLLDQLGSLAVGQLSQQFYQRLETDAAVEGLHISTYLSPGESEWSIKDQAVIFDLLDATQIGVSLTESLLMMPVKSLSLMAGIGSQPMGVPGATHCDYCTMSDRCPFHGKHGTI
jgi:hypothetical protein